MKEVATEAGVSLTTVSDALNGTGRLPEVTRQRVRAAAERLGYQPHRSAQSLARGRTGILMLSVPLPEASPSAGVDIEFFVQLMSAASAAALHRGWALVLAPLSQGQLAVRMDFDGAVVVDPLPHDPLLAAADAEGKPVVTIGRDFENASRLHVDNDHGRAVAEALDHMAQAGARRPALLASPPSSSYVRDCIDGYHRWCDVARVKPLVAIAKGGLTESAGYAAARTLMEGHLHPDAIFTTLDSLALGTLLAAQSLGIAVPQNLQVVTLSDSAAARRAHPAITAVDLNPAQIGKEAIELLLRAMDGSGQPQSVTVPATLVIRASTTKTAVARSS